MLGHRARRRFSQNFLHDAHYIGRIADAVGPRAGEVVVEIGPGLGALTDALVARGAHPTCIEIDRDLAQRLRAREAAGELRLIEADALALDWAALAEELLAPPVAAGSGLRIVGNLPYHISTPLLFALLPIAGRVRDEHFMLQREVVDRMAAAPDSADYGRLSVMLQWRYRVEKLFNVPAGAFTPAPKVQSSIVRLVPRAQAELPDVDPAAFARVVTTAFTQRRKTLRNALGQLLGEAQIAAAGVDPGVRAETLDVAAFVRLARCLG